MLSRMLLTGICLLLTVPILAQTRGASRVVGKESTLSGFYGKTWAVIIGIDDYPGLSYNLQLQQAVKDAKGIEKALRDQFRFDKIITLFNEDATKVGILKVLQGNLSEAGENDGVFVFFAGHGSTITTVDGDLGYLLPYDGSFKGTENYKNISMTTLKNDVAKGVPAKHIFFVMDACYSGLLLAQRGPGDGEPDAGRLDYLKEITRERARQVLSAGGKGQTVLDGGRNGHSVFTGRFLQALEDADGYITAKEIGYQVPQKVFYDAQDRGHKQQPQFGRLAGQGDFVFVKPVVQKSQSTLGAGQAEDLKAQLEVEALQKQVEELKRQREVVNPSVPSTGSSAGEMVLVSQSDYPFYFDKYEVTNAQYAEFVRVTGHRQPECEQYPYKSPWNTWSAGRPPSGYENHPVVGVSLDDAKAYCEWAEKRLPTEGEWQEACQGKLGFLGFGGRVYPWGDGFDTGNVNISGSVDGYGNTAPVGSFPGGASPDGAMDMAGNVWGLPITAVKPAWGVGNVSAEITTSGTTTRGFVARRINPSAVAQAGGAISK